MVVGAAYLAGLAEGVWKDVSEVESFWRVERRFEPQMNDTRRASLMDGWRSAINRARS